MFQRGQKIIILKSSAKTKSHPNIGDIGYLNNIYLFPEHRFILLDGFFFNYKSGKENKNRSERKKFIIDLGMKSSFRYKISYQGVPVSFFARNDDVVNLSSVGYHLGKITQRSSEIHLLDYPILCGNLGIWPGPRKKSKVKVTKFKDKILVKAEVKDEKVDEVKDKLVKIPHGQIALVSTRSDSNRYQLETCDKNEFQAWLQSMIPVVSSMLEIFCSYTRIYNLNKMRDGCFNKAYAAYSAWIAPYLSYTVSPGASSYCFPSSYRFRQDFGNVAVSAKKDIIKSVNFLKSLTNIFLSRLDLYFINYLIRTSRERSSFVINGIVEAWISEGFLPSIPKIAEPAVPYYQLLRSVFFRNLLTDTSHGALRLLTNYLPKGWAEEAYLEEKAKIFENIRKASSSDSAALNRIYRILK